MGDDNGVPNDNDYAFMKRVADAYDATLDEDTGNGSIREVAFKFLITRVKVRKILITMGKLYSPITAQAQELRQEGCSIKTIAEIMNMSPATISTYLPYETVLYNGAERSVDAIRAQDYRNRIKVVKNQILRKQSANSNEAEELRTMSSVETPGMAMWKEIFKSGEVERYICPQYPGVLNDKEWPQEKLDQLPNRSDDRLRLHLELVPNWYCEEERQKGIETLKKYGEVQYGENISRDIIVSGDMPLFALHYIIQRAFGWQNSHLHHFELLEERFKQITDGLSGNWANLVGLVFQSPYMDEDERFWNDDYDNGSVKTWFRKKYTGPYISLCRGESYAQCKKDVKKICRRMKMLRVQWSKPFGTEEHIDSVCPAYDEDGKASKVNQDKEITRTEILPFEKLPVEALTRLFETAPNMLLERLSVQEVFALGDRQLIDDTHPMADGDTIRETYEDFMEDMDEEFGMNPNEKWDTPMHQPMIGGITDTLLYNYDYGDNWFVKITGSWNCADLVERGRLTQEELDAAALTEWKTHRPVCIARDGLNVLDDVGGMGGYLQFLRAINKDTSDDNGMYDNKDSSLEWAKSLGWNKRKISNQNVL